MKKYLISIAALLILALNCTAQSNELSITQLLGLMQAKSIEKIQSVISPFGFDKDYMEIAISVEKSDIEEYTWPQRLGMISPYIMGSGFYLTVKFNNARHRVESIEYRVPEFKDIYPLEKNLNKKEYKEAYSRIPLNGNPNLYLNKRLKILIAFYYSDLESQNIIFISRR